MTDDERDYERYENERNRFRRKLILTGAITLFATLLAGILYFVASRRSSPIDNHPDAASLIAGQMAMQEERFQDALADFARAEAEGGELPVPILFDRAQALLQLGQTTEGEQQLRELLAREPRHIGANELLCALLRVAGRNWEIRPHFLELIRQDVFSAGNLAAITSNDNVAVNRSPPGEIELEEFLIQSSEATDGSLARLAKARFLLGHNHLDPAFPLLERIVNEQPDLLDAQARLGAWLLNSNRSEEIPEWHNKLPANAALHPDIWMVRGRWLELQGDRRAAARCYWETLRRFPDHPSATYRLSQVLFALDRRAEAALFAERAAQINEIQTSIAIGWSPPSAIQTLAERLESLGRLWESLGWSLATIERDPGGDVAWAVQRVERLRRVIKLDMPLVLDSSNLAMSIDLTDLPLPDWNDLQRTPHGVAPVISVASQIKFVDSAKDAGISFSYYNGADPARAYMFEFGGGGVAVLDYDADGWPDLYLTQGCEWPVQPQQQKYSDRLLRNLGNGRFEDVTERAGLRGHGFGQGVTVGDIDNDGWPDLYIANIGLNQLYHNNGDGTFTDITASSGVTGTQWTLSTLIADLNGDSWPELYDVNYLGGPAIFNKVCYRDGQPVQCFPNQFPGEQDRVYQNLGNGSFRDVSQQAGIVLPDGKGMGIVAADMDGSGRLSLFIANDTTNNFFFLNRTQRPGAELKFSEQALRSGLALSETGTARSCMGIAAGDVSGDGRLDLFVTNFHDEANNLYVQGDDLLFDDRIRHSLLHDLGYLMEGWGTQFIDADLDGLLDLVVANGHLDDYPHSPGTNRMPTQFFRNVGGGRFAELTAAESGSFFAAKSLGRALARLDWNRDGRPDFCVTHVDAPFSLLTNQTTESGNYLAVHLRGVESARDAIGTTVSLRVGDQIRVQQLTAGDGFQASNQRHLIFGLGKDAQVVELTIRWPAGKAQTFHGLGADSAFVFIEGQEKPVPLHARN